MERATRKLFWFFALLFVLLIGNLTYVQVFAAPKLNADPSNTRAIEAQMRIERGLILTADGQEVATNTQEGEYFLRHYPAGGLHQPWLGYNSVQYGRAGVELAYNAELSGELDVLQVTSLIDQIMGRPQRGADLRLTVDSRVQQAAVEALGERAGAVVALDPKTGAVLAMTSYPRFDANTLSEDWDSLVNNESRPLFNRATQGQYPPGSVFKVVVASAALQEGAVTADSSFDDTGEYVAGGYKVTNFGGETYGEHTFGDALTKSINTTFARVGVELGADTLARYASAFGMGAEVPWRLGGQTGSFPNPADMDTAHVAQVSFGQGEVVVSPLEMALVAAGIANEGTIMKPYLVSEVRDYRQTLVESAQPEVWKQAIAPSTARMLTTLMERVVDEGTGTNAAIDGVKVAGKTGTAEVDQGEPHAWFIAFAPADDPQIAVAVIVEHGGTGGSTAAPIAREVIQAALARE